MEEKILNELKSINMQLHEFDSKLKAQKEEICTEFDSKLKAQKEEICTEFDSKLKALNEKICTEFDSKLKALNEKICTEFDVKLNVLERKFIDDSSEAFKENINFLYEMKNKAHEEMLNELRDHKVRTLKGVKAFERALTAV